MKIWVHTLVRNEERYLWFAVTSVIDYVDKVLLWDTASTDSTVGIIKLLKKRYPKKIDFRQLGQVDPEKFTLARQEMLNVTKSDWFILVDGDEVWWEDSINKVVKLIKKDGGQLESVVNEYTNVVGDIYHYQEERAGRYQIDGHVGHLTIRAMNRNIPGLHFGKPHGQQGIFDENETLIQEGSNDRRVFIDGTAYLHFTHMIRSRNLEEDLKVMKRNIKVKHELGRVLPSDFYYPEVFFRQRPGVIPSPWKNMKLGYYLRPLAETPLRKIKRRIFRGKSGY